MNINTKFADMTIGDRNGWLTWANQHDWGSDQKAWFDPDTDEMVVYGAEWTTDTGWQVVEARHSTPKAMRDWAGY